MSAKTTFSLPLERLRAGCTPAVVLGDLSLVRPIGEAGIPVVLATPEPEDVALRSRYVTAHAVVPPFDDAHIGASAAAIVALGAELHRTLGRRLPLFYNSDKNLELIYRHRDALSEHYLMLLNEPETAWALHDKGRFYAMAERAGVRAPKTLETSEAIDARLFELREPLLVKPKLKTDWKGIQRELFDGEGKARVFATREALLAHPGFAKHKGAVIVQEYLEGGVDDLVSFHGLANENGELLASYCGKKIRTYPWFAGESSFIELVRDAAVDGEGRSVARKLGLKGPFKIDFIRDGREGALYTLEINARFNLWNQLGAACGVNLPALAHAYLVEGRRPVREPAYATNYKWLHFYRDLQAFKEGRGRGGPGLGAWLGSIADPNIVHETFAWTDPAPFVQWVGEFVRDKLDRGGPKPASEPGEKGGAA